MADIKGYRTLSADEIALINEAKDLAEQVGAFLDKFAPTTKLTTAGGEFDYRWVCIARTHLQEGFMALTRAIAKPTNF